MVGANETTLGPQREPAQNNLDAPDFLTTLLETADVRFNGDRDWDIQVRSPELYDQVLRRGSLGFGESYMDGAWESARLDETFNRLLRANLDRRITSITKIRFATHLVNNLLTNRQSRKRAFHVGKRHYDIGNDVYTAMLDPTMSYSCGYWRDAENLERAQLAKLRLICEKLELKASESLLDIGCGWGGLSRFAAENYGVTHATDAWIDKLRRAVLPDVQVLPELMRRILSFASGPTLAAHAIEARPARSLPLHPLRRLPEKNIPDRAGFSFGFKARCRAHS